MRRRRPPAGRCSGWSRFPGSSSPRRGIEPGNNHAESKHQHVELLRKSSGETDSEAGSPFVERQLMVLATCQLRGLLDYLTTFYQDRLSGEKLPSLIPMNSPVDSVA